MQTRIEKKRGEKRCLTMTSFVCRAKVGGSGNKPQSMYSALYYCCTVRSIATITPTFQRDFFTLFCSLGNSYCSTQKMDYTLFSVSKGDGIPYSIEQTQKPDYNCLNWPVIDRCMEAWRGGEQRENCGEEEERRTHVLFSPSSLLKGGWITFSPPQPSWFSSSFLSPSLCSGQSWD